ncbi:tRNA 2-selenouridine synthase [Campylobacter concisus]|uniref:tRNA 2-selenouridine synthase n=1 Tax=Campylobacter concisus TaxID=199 RepID=A0A7S9NDL0_9BACT|nr:tRNA 2-selenouridine synthase [Campylobacter concisus]QPH83794.1 tRNA 2-selenouridine synthase [Campylobacter concisus]
MRFTAFILLLLTSIFLIACSANQANKKISNSELENLAKQYGGVYIFDEKFEKEIERREKERSDYMDDFFKNNKRNFKRADLEIMDQKFPQTLSNGKKYYTSWLDYERDTGKKAEIPEKYISKIKELMGNDNYKKSPNRPILVGFYEDNNQIVPIELSMSYTYYKTKYGLFGDEGMGIRFKDEERIFIPGGNKFILINNKFIKANKDK